MLRDVGSISIEEADDANVPVVCFLMTPEENDTNKWVWEAQNFMPRKERCGDTFRLEADTKEEIMGAIEKYVIPLYEAAITNLRNKGENYYWWVNDEN